MWDHASRPARPLRVVKPLCLTTDRITDASTGTSEWRTVLRTNTARLLVAGRALVKIVGNGMRPVRAGSGQDVDAVDLCPPGQSMWRSSNRCRCPGATLATSNEREHRDPPGSERSRDRVAAVDQPAQKADISLASSSWLRCSSGREARRQRAVRGIAASERLNRICVPQGTKTADSLERRKPPTSGKGPAGSLGIAR